MLVRTYVPKYPLADFIDYMWYMEGYQPAHARELAFPDGSAEIVFDLVQDVSRLYDDANRECVTSGSVVCGPHTKYFVIDTYGESRVLGIHFKPGGLHPFVRMPLDELLNAHVSLEQLWGRQAAELRLQLAALDEPEEMFAALERHLLQLLPGGFVTDPAVRYVLERIDQVRVGELIEQIGMSHRRFIDIFQRHIGMTPKRMSRIARFQHVLTLAGDEAERNWCDIALQCGYYDQAHFIKDFQAFSGIRPSDYASIPGRHHNHAGIPG